MGLVQEQFEEYVLGNHIGAWTWYDQPTNQTEPFSPPIQPNKDWMESCKPHEHFSCWVTDCSTIRILSSGITDHQPVGLMYVCVGGGGDSTSAVIILYSPGWQGRILEENDMMVGFIACQLLLGYLMPKSVIFKQLCDFK